MERVWGGGEKQGVDKYEQEWYAPPPDTEAGVLRIRQAEVAVHIVNNRKYLGGSQRAEKSPQTT